MNAQHPSFSTTLLEGAAELGFTLSDRHVSDLSTLIEDLLDWNQRMNLTAARDPFDIVVKHILDSMTCLTLAPFPGEARLLDVGTGAGFPGLVISILRPDTRVTLMDSTRKKLSFVQHVVDRLELRRATVTFGRAEDAAHSDLHREAYDIVVARAVAPMRILSELCVPFVRLGGVFLAMKGPNLAGEMLNATQTIARLGGQASTPIPFSLPFGGGQRAIISVMKTSHTPGAFPRLYRDIRRQPL